MPIATGYGDTRICQDGKRRAFADADVFDQLYAGTSQGSVQSVEVDVAEDDQVDLVAAVADALGTRVVSDGATTNADPTVTSNDANFTASDEGASISGTGIPAGAKIGTVTDEHTIELVDAAGDPVNASATGTDRTLTIVRSEDHQPSIGDLYPKGAKVTVQVETGSGSVRIGGAQVSETLGVLLADGDAPLTFDVGPAQGLYAFGVAASELEVTLSGR
jgi:hypothetical protein